MVVCIIRVTKIGVLAKTSPYLKCIKALQQRMGCWSDYSYFLCHLSKTFSSTPWHLFQHQFLDAFLANCLVLRWKALLLFIFQDDLGAIWACDLKDLKEASKANKYTFKAN